MFSFLWVKYFFFHMNMLFLSIYFSHVLKIFFLHIWIFSISLSNLQRDINEDGGSKLINSKRSNAPSPNTLKRMVGPTFSLNHGPYHHLVRHLFMNTHVTLIVLCHIPHHFSNHNHTEKLWILNNNIFPISILYIHI